MFKSYGDVNFFDGGILIQRVDEERREFEILTCYPDGNQENNYQFVVATVDLDAVEKDTMLDVCRFAGMPEYTYTSYSDYDDHEELLYRLASDCVSYSSSTTTEYDAQWKSKNEVIDFINHGYIEEIDWDFYESNFYETNRNCVVRICRNDGIGMASTKIYKTLEDAAEDWANRAEKGWSIEVVDK